MNGDQYNQPVYLSINAERSQTPSAEFYITVNSITATAILNCRDPKKVLRLALDECSESALTINHVRAVLDRLGE